MMVVPAAMAAFINVASSLARRRGSNYGQGYLCRRMTAPSAGNGADNDMQERFNEMEHRNWEKGYQAYDQGFGPLTRQTIPALLSAAAYPPISGDEERPCRLLDVATGPGFVLSAAIDAALARENGRHYHLTGLDITQNFLALAEERIREKMHQRNGNQIEVDFVEGSAEALPFPDDTFDSIVCNFGILHFFNPEVFLQESYRVLRPGGRVSFSAWSPPSRTEGFRLALESIEEAGNPNVEGLPEGPQFFTFGDSEQASAAMREVEFESVNSLELSDMTWDNVKDGAMLYSVLLDGTSRTREVLLGQTEEEATAIQTLIAKKYDSITDGSERPLSMPAVITSGEKPA